MFEFGLKAEKHDEFKHWFKQNYMTVNTREDKLKYCEVQAKISARGWTPGETAVVAIIYCVDK